MIPDICVKNLVKKTDEEIIEEIGMAHLPLIVHVFHKKYHRRVRFINIGEDCMLRYGNTNIANMSYLAVHLHFLKIKNNTLFVEGNVSIPAVYKNDCDLHVLVNNKVVEHFEFDADLDQYIDGEKYEVRTAFKFSYDLEGSSSVEILFKLTTCGIYSLCNKINSYRFMPVSDVLPSQYKIFGKYAVSIRGNCIKIWKIKNFYESKKLEELFESSLMTINSNGALEAINIRKKYFSMIPNKKQIWLFFDRYDKADDNGEIFFKYVCQMKRRDVDAFYIIDSDSSDYSRLSKIGNTVPAFSDAHKLLLLLADYIFTSQLNGFVENPFNEDSEYYRDLYHDAKVVFLQHGVTKDDQSKWLHRYKQNLYAIVVSSLREKNEFLRIEYGLKEEQIWLTGMPRFDELYHNEKKQILIMPTWRKSLMQLKRDDDIGVSRWMAKKEFEDSQYLKKYNKLLNSKVIKKMCDYFGYDIAFVPHPLSRPYEKSFHVPDWIKQYPYYQHYKDIFSESNLMITDYSSVAFDFAYLKKPVIYYQFDKRDFFSSHTYKKGYFNYKKDGFGHVVNNEISLMIIIWSVLKNDCKIKKCFEQNVHNFFNYLDDNNCKRILEKIL